MLENYFNIKKKEENKDLFKNLNISRASKEIREATRKISNNKFKFKRCKIWQLGKGTRWTKRHNVKFILWEHRSIRSFEWKRDKRI